MVDFSAITVAVCTFRRPYLVTALESILTQKNVDQTYHVLVVDNDDTDTARQIVAPFMEQYGDRVRYVHAPARNISIARNAALDNAKTRWLAFVDDDEFAAHDWLRHMASCQGAADVVLGPVHAVYADGSPRWAAVCDFHSTRAKDDIWNAYTGNVMLDLAKVRECWARFDIRHGLTGGEDTFFFPHLKAHGATITYAGDAAVYEEVPASRARLSWVLRRKFRSGQTHMDIQKDERKLFVASTAFAKSAFSLAMSLVQISSSRRVFWIARASFHAGVVSKLFGVDTHQEYGVTASQAGNISSASPLRRVGLDMPGQRSTPPVLSN